MELRLTLAPSLIICHLLLLLSVYSLADGGIFCRHLVDTYYHLATSSIAVPVYMYRRESMVDISACLILSYDGRMCRVCRFGFRTGEPSFVAASVTRSHVAISSRRRPTWRLAWRCTASSRGPSPPPPPPSSRRTRPPSSWRQPTAAPPPPRPRPTPGRPSSRRRQRCRRDSSARLPPPTSSSRRHHRHAHTTTSPRLIYSPPHSPITLWPATSRIMACRTPTLLE